MGRVLAWISHHAAPSWHAELCLVYDDDSRLTESAYRSTMLANDIGTVECPACREFIKLRPEMVRILADDPMKYQRKHNVFLQTLDGTVVNTALRGEDVWQVWADMREKEGKEVEHMAKLKDRVPTLVLTPGQGIDLIVDPDSAYDSEVIQTRDGNERERFIFRAKTADGVDVRVRGGDRMMSAIMLAVGNSKNAVKVHLERTIDGFNYTCKRL